MRRKQKRVKSSNHNAPEKLEHDPSRAGERQIKFSTRRAEEWEPN